MRHFRLKIGSKQNEFRHLAFFPQESILLKMQNGTLMQFSPSSCSWKIDFKFTK
jgi:hypothetical protein